MSSFSLPTINDNPDGGWGPSFSTLPSQFKFKDIPYAPYSKSDKLGRFADWNDISGDNRQTNLGVASGQGARGAATGGRRRDGQPAFGSGTASAFAYFHAEDESSFSLVDSKATTARRGGAMSRGRTSARGGSKYLKVISRDALTDRWVKWTVAAGAPRQDANGRPQDQLTTDDARLGEVQGHGHCRCRQDRVRPHAQG